MKRPTNPRTYLFVPGERPERFDKAAASGADAIMLDLEDAVASAAKSTAREAVGEWLQRLPEDGRERAAVRINDASTPWFGDDVAMLARCNAVRVMLPKAESTEQIAMLRLAVNGIGVVALIESARGVAAAEAIAASPGVVRLAYGTLDFALDLDIPPEPVGLQHAAGRIVIASRAAGLPAPVAGVTPELSDEAKLLADFAWARALGFGAKLCIHPKQVAPLHAALRPGDDEIAWARRVIAAADAAQGAAVQLDGRMIDKPVLQRAHGVLARTSD